MSNITLLFNSLTDGEVLSGGAWQPSLPLTCLQTRDVGDIARTTNLDLASTQINFQMLNPKPAYGLVVGPLNATENFKYRATEWQGAIGGGIKYQSDWIQPWAGATARDFDPERGAWLFHVLSGFGNTQNVTLEMDDQTNPDGYLQAGRGMLMEGYQPPINYEYGSNGLGLIDNTVRSAKLSGGESVWRRVNPRLFRFQLGLLPEDTEYREVHRLQRIVGFDKQVFVIPDPEDPARRRLAKCFLATIRQMDALQQAVYRRFTTSFELKEEISGMPIFTERENVPPPGEGTWLWSQLGDDEERGMMIDFISGRALVKGHTTNYYGGINL